jgi:hypothetical protein
LTIVVLGSSVGAKRDGLARRLSMNRNLLRVGLAIALTAAVAAVTISGASGQDDDQGPGLRRGFAVRLIGYQEVPAISSVASGSFRATIQNDGSIAWKLTYAGLEGDVTQSHIHVGQAAVNGGISVFFCTNLGNGPAGTPACPPSPATLQGVIHPADVIGPTAQGVSAGELKELVDALRAGVAYVNVHSTKWPGGEIRAQLR